MRLPNRELSRAVFVGVGDYVDSNLGNLRGVHRGAEELCAALTDPEVGSLSPQNCVTVRQDATREQVGRSIKDASDLAEDLLLVYYAGHGLRGLRPDELYLTVAATRSDDATITGINYREVRDLVSHSDAKAKIVILDCCFSGRACGQPMTVEAMAVERAIVDDIAIEGTAVLTSVSSNDLAWIRDNEKYPAYTGRLIEFLRNGIPGAPDLLNIQKLHRALRKSLADVNLRPPQARLEPLLDELGIVRNRAAHAPHGDDTSEPSSCDSRRRTTEATSVPKSDNASPARTSEAPPQKQRHHWPTWYRKSYGVLLTVIVVLVVVGLMTFDHLPLPSGNGPDKLVEHHGTTPGPPIFPSQTLPPPPIASLPAPPPATAPPHNHAMDEQTKPPTARQIEPPPSPKYRIASFDNKPGRLYVTCRDKSAAFDADDQNRTVRGARAGGEFEIAFYATCPSFGVNGTGAVFETARPTKMLSVGVARPKPADCAAEAKTGEPRNFSIDADELPPGSSLCMITSEGRVLFVTITEYSGMNDYFTGISVDFTITTWEAV